MGPAATPVLVAQLSDPHVQVDGDETAVRGLAAAVRAVAELDPAPLTVLVSGDLAEHGRPAEYERVRELLAPLTMPVHVLAGNHDDRDALRASFAAGPASAGPGDPYRYSVRCGPLRLVACDTTWPGHDAGRLDAERLDWLDAELSAVPDVPTIVAMHHPPLLTGIRELDEIGLPPADGLALGDVLVRHPQVLRVVAGHVHRTVVGSVGGRPVLACPSTYLQAELDLGEGRLALVPAPPAFALHLAVDGELFSHVVAIT